MCNLTSSHSCLFLDRTSQQSSHCESKFRSRGPCICDESCPGSGKVCHATTGTCSHRVGLPVAVHTELFIQMAETRNLFSQCPQSGEEVGSARRSSPQSHSSHGRSSCWKPPLLHAVQLHPQAPGCSYFHASNGQCTSQYASPCYSHSSKPRTGELLHLLGHI